MHSFPYISTGFSVNRQDSVPICDTWFELEEHPMDSVNMRIEKSVLENFCTEVFSRLGLSSNDAKIASMVLVAADARGIPSHGIGRLGRYVEGLVTRQMLPDVKEKIITDSSTTLVIDACGAMGAPASVRAMQSIIHKAKTNGVAFGCVKNSNHFGIAAYYAMMALEEDMIGIAMTNTASLGVPTHASQVMFGTNPIAFAAPAKKESAFVLDMSTTVVTRGKLEVYDRLGKDLPEGWAVDKEGLSTRNAGSMLRGMLDRVGGGILPLGGLGMDFGGHKGYGLAVMVDILCAVLCGAPFGKDVFDTPKTSARVSHFFGAIKIERFRDPESFKSDMDSLLESLRNTPKAKGQDRVYYAGLPEFEKEQECIKLGVPVLKKTFDSISAIGEKYGVLPPAVIKG
jgi:L-2-hydroxycarboxylate dehydrogenase (NAD+)